MLLRVVVKFIVMNEGPRNRHGVDSVSNGRMHVMIKEVVVKGHGQTVCYLVQCDVDNRSEHCTGTPPRRISL